MIKKVLYLTLLLASLESSIAQQRSLEWEDIRSWNRITSQMISDDGDYIIAEIQPWVGDSKVNIYNSNGDLLKELDGAQRPMFINNNRVISTITPANQLAIYDIKGEELQIIDSLKDVKRSSKNNNWIAYRTGESKKLTITNLKDEEEFDNVAEYSFSDQAEKLIFNQYIKDSISTIIVYNLEKGSIESQIALDKGDKSQRLSVSKSGEVAYIVTGEQKSGSGNRLLFFDGEATSSIDISSLQSDWIVNENYSPRFAENSDRLFFGISPQYPVADTTIMESEKAKVDVWIWDEPKLKTQQKVDYNQDIKRSYQVVYNTKSGDLMQIATSEIPNSRLFSSNGDSDLALIDSNEQYLMESMWTGNRRSDIYIKNIVSGEQKLLLKGESASVRVSPDEKYIYWYQPRDSSWYAYTVAEDRIITLTTPDVVEAFNPSQNVPDLPTSYGYAGWSDEDKLFYIYDKYDVWAIDPTGKKAPARITDGYKSATTYRISRLDRSKESFESKEKVMLKLFDNTTKQSGFASLSLSKPNSVKLLTKGDFIYGTPIKAKESDMILFTRENFEEFPNLYCSDIEFKGEPTIITDVNPQQKEFLWGSVEPITWVSLDGDTLQGNLYKPANFDPSRKYPMICNFYERDSENLFSHRIPEVHRSSIDYHYYTSNGYVIFNPDIKYVDGYPGESCFNSLMPGISKILEMGFVDASKIGAQGHSWGGYQVAYLATRTDIFAAIESGAPVVNMISAYGGIRWASGLNRAFQYEHGQSRIGASPWESPSRYTENSPIYSMDKVNTPILIMHNDKDGHVPWWQGIEFFVALRRLEKPAWMLNYNDEPHWPTTAPNKFDFQTKMSQFFHHYLKDEPMPEWMVK